MLTGGHGPLKPVTPAVSPPVPQPPPNRKLGERAKYAHGRTRSRFKPVTPAVSPPVPATAAEPEAAGADTVRSRTLTIQ